MKKLLLTSLVLAGFAAGAFAQGSFVLDNSSFANGISVLTSGNYYTGTAGIEVWELNAAAVPAGLTSYAQLQTDGFTLEQTLASQSINVGSISLGNPILMKDVSPAGTPVVVALAAWNNAQPTYAAGAAVTGADSGILAFVQPTANYNATPPPTPPGVAWPNQDLIMVPTPEPSIFALTGLGAAALLIFRRRK